MPKGSKWGRREETLKKQSKKRGIKDKGAYVFGTMRKMGWKPSREKRRMRGG